MVDNSFHLKDKKSDLGTLKKGSACFPHVFSQLQILAKAKPNTFLHSFMQVSTQQSEMDSKFLAMKRTISLLEKYGQKLPETTEKFYKAAPQR